MLYVNSAGTALAPGAHALLLSGKVPAGASMEFLNSQAPTFEEWLKTHPPKTDTERELQALVSAMFAVESPTQALYAPKGVPPERLAALREAFAQASKDSSVKAKWLRLGIPPERTFTHEEILENLSTVVADLGRVRQLLGVTATP